MKIEKIIYLDEIDSTNNYAKMLAEENENEGTVVVAKKQKDGRGRHGRTWLSPEGGLYLSIILRPNLYSSGIQKITLLSAVAVAEVIEKVASIKCALKWPNDVWVNGKKICGILTEAKFENDKPRYVIVGIGINVNFEVENLNNDFLYPVTSIIGETGAETPLQILTERILLQFGNYYEKSIKNGYDEILQKWRGRSNTLGKKIKVITKEGEISGYCKDIDNDGMLLLQDNKNNIIKVMEGDIFFIN